MKALLAPDNELLNQPHGRSAVSTKTGKFGMFRGITLLKTNTSVSSCEMGMANDHRSPSKDPAYRSWKSRLTKCQVKCSICVTELQEERDAYVITNAGFVVLIEVLRANGERGHKRY